MAKVNKNMLIGQLIKLDPNIVAILMRAGITPKGEIFNKGIIVR